MITMRGHIANGTVQFDEPLPADWPDGTKIEARLAAPLEYEQMTEENWPTTPEGIQDWINWLDGLEPFLETEEEEKDFQRALEEQKAWELANWDAHVKKIEGLFK